MVVSETMANDFQLSSPGYQAELKALQDAEKGLVFQYQCRLFSDFFRSVWFRNPYTIRSLPETIHKLRFSFKFSDLQQRRALFNYQASKGMPLSESFMDSFLPYRAGIRYSPEFMKVYESYLERLSRQFLFFKVTYYPHCCEKVPLTDWSSIHLFCAQVLEVFRNRLDLVDRLLTQCPHGFHIQFCTQTLRTYFDPGYIQINPIVLWGETTSEQSPGVTHAMLHLLSQGQDGKQTDFLPDMTDAQRHTIRALKTRLEQQFAKQDTGIMSVFRTLLTNNTTIGFNGYAFLDQQAEFLTTAIENCLKQPEAVQQTEAGKTVLDFFSGYFRWEEHAIRNEEKSSFHEVGFCDKLTPLVK